MDTYASNTKKDFRRLIMGWTHWKKLANLRDNYSYDIDYSKSAVYELGVRRRSGKYITPVYVGETSDLKRRMKDYANTGSHLRSFANKYWRMGYTVFFRFQDTKSKSEAKKLQDALLKRHGLERYPWNNNFSTGN